MKKTAFVAMALAGVSLFACKPTERTATQHQQDHEKQQQSLPPKFLVQPGEATAKAPENTPREEQPALADTQQETQDTTLYLLEVGSTRQDFSLMRPWEKEPVSESSLMGVYLGDGKVLTFGDAVKAATYLELRLPDGSATAPARVIRYNPDLNLALLTVAHEEDASLFEGRKKLELGEPLKMNDKAEFWGTVQGIRPSVIPVSVESSGSSSSGMPRLSLKAATAIPTGNNSYGLPIVRDGKLCGLTTGYSQNTQVFTTINSELIARFLDKEQADMPALGLVFAELDDPVFRRYLKLPENQGGLYISKVAPESAAATAGIMQGDVLTTIEGMPIDLLGRCEHPLYDAIDATAILRGAKPVGEVLNVTVSRDGLTQNIAIPLNRDAIEKSLLGEDKPGEQPRYLMYGGLLFQPLTPQYMEALRKVANGALPVQFLELEDRTAELRAEGRTELVVLTLVVPTPATLSYDPANFCHVETVNGTIVRDFSHFAQLLDAPAEDGLIKIGINKSPYMLVLDQRIAEACNESIRTQAIPCLRVLHKPGETPAAPAQGEPAGNKISPTPES